MNAKELFEAAGKEYANLEARVREIVRTRAWKELGHPNFATAWHAVTGMKCPSQVKIIATYAMFDEGMNTLRPLPRVDFVPNGLLVRDVAEAIGWGGRNPAPVVHLKQQHAHGVPANKATTSSHSPSNRSNYTVREAIEQHGTRSYVGPAKGSPRRTGAGPDDLVSESFNLPRWEADAVSGLARTWSCTKAEVYRRLLTPQIEALRPLWQEPGKAMVRK